MKKGFKEAFKVFCTGIIIMCIIIGIQVAGERKAYDNRAVENINVSYDNELNEFVFNALYDNDDLIEIATKDVLDAEHIVALDVLNNEFQGKQVDVVDIIAKYNELLVALDNVKTYNISGRTYIKATNFMDIKALEGNFE